MIRPSWIPKEAFFGFTEVRQSSHIPPPDHPPPRSTPYGRIRPDGVTPSIVLRSYASSWTGYGQIGEWLGRGLERHGVAVGYCPLRSNEDYHPTQSFVTTRRVGLYAAGAKVVQLATPHTEPLDLPTVAFTMWEVSRITPEAVARLNRTLAVVVPCQWNADCFRECGVTVPIHVVPLGVSAAEGYTPKPWPGGPFTFGMAARMAHGGIRKGLNEGMAAFVKAFPHGEDVRLVVKVFEDCRPALRVPDDPRIVITTTPMLPPEMSAWYGTIHCLLVPSKGEGFGLHTLQAMACGRPVIAAKQTGTAEFFTDDCGWGLDGSWEPAGEFYAGQGDWFVPTEASMVSRMRDAYASPDLCRQQGAAAAQRAAEFAWKRTGDGLHAVLAGLGLAKTPPQPARPLPVIECDHRILGKVGCCTRHICGLHGGRYAPAELCDECDDQTGHRG